jgi:nucleoid-associated protein YgaU
MRRVLGVAQFSALVAGEIGSVLLLHRLGRVAGFAVPHHDVVRWMVQAPTEDLFAVSARVLGLVLAWWLLAATVLSTARRAVAAWQRRARLDSVTPAVVRRCLDRALAVGLGASLGLGSMHPAGATTRPSPVTATVSVPARDEPVVRSPARHDSSHPAPGRPAAGAAEPRAQRLVIVRAGDNLWVIAERALQHPDRLVEDREIAPYWRRVIAANTATLRSHDPNLIFPGERVVLPPG